MPKRADHCRANANSVTATSARGSPEKEHKVSPEAERSDVVASPQPVCAVCGGPRGPRKQEACSDKCRAELSRQRRMGDLRARDDEIRALPATALKKLDEGAL